MNERTANVSVTDPIRNPIRRNGFRSFRRFLTVASFIGLGVLNILVVVSDAVHAFAYEAVSAASRALPEEVASRLLENSPTAKARREITLNKAALSAELDAVARRNKALVGQVSTLDEKHRILSTKHLDLEKAHTDLGTKHFALGKAHLELKGEHAELARLSAKRAEAVKKFSTALGVRVANNVSRNVASIPGEAIPFVGTAFVIGVTSWDVYDACQTLKELNEVNLEFAYAPEDHEKVCGTKVPSKSEIVAQVKGNWREAYRAAADALSHAGERVPATLPEPSWQDVKDTVCPVIGSPRILCQ